MSSLIMSNGEYGDDRWYGLQKTNFERVICTDGAAAKARALGILPDILVGDMDSIHEDDLLFMEQNRVKFYRHPPEKDFTDTFLALQVAEENHWNNITVWGGTGGRLDHTLANLFGVVSFVRRGMNLIFDEPDLTVHIIRDHLSIKGSTGDTVSVFPMGERVKDLTLTGFKYPLKNATLEPDYPIGISNIMFEEESNISIGSGILAVFHNRNLV
ncbi:MAG: thiamine diphosphokinase [Anaerovoracaceae bacterium]